LGIEALWDQLQQYQALGADTLTERRRQQALQWFHQLIDEGIQRTLHAQPKWSSALAEAQTRILNAQQTPPDAAASLLADCFKLS
jgi:putative protein kinase ArgK-like GTPase of G3E family